MARFFKVGSFSARAAWRRNFPSLWFLVLLAVSTAPAAEPKPAKTPKPAQISVSGYGVLGNRELKRILRTVELGGKKPEFFGPSFVEDSAMILAARVKRDGYLEPTITIRLRLDNGDRIVTRADTLLESPLPRPMRIRQVQFQIHKGILYHFQQLEFSGLETINEKQARSYFMETETLLHLKSARVFTPERLRRGLASLTDVFDRQGYADATAEADKVVRDDRNGNVSVHITVKQGPRFFVRSVREEFYYGTNSAPESSRTVFPNKPYSTLWQQDFVLMLKTNQYRLGYPDTAVEVQKLRQQPEDHREEVDLLARVKSGEQIRIGNVEFKGQKRTRRWLMSRRVRIERGELLDPVLVEQGRSRLARLGVFDSVGFEYVPAGDNIRDVIYDVKEGKRLNVSLLFGYGTYELLRGGVEVDAYNLWGRAHHAELLAVQSFKATSGNFTYTIPEVAGRDVDFFLNSSGLRREEISFTRVEYGGGAGIHKYFNSEATDFTARYNYQILNAQEFGTFPEIASEGLTNPAVGSIAFEIKHDRRDNPLYPRKGYKVFLTVETATEYLGGDANFERVEISSSWHHPIGGGRYVSLGLQHSVDLTFGSVEHNLPFNRRFFPGGQNSIRGYTEGEASPINAAGQILGAETYTLGTVELEQALTPKFSFVLFSDNLGMAHRMESYPWDTGLFTIGAGLRWRTIIGPVRLEYGYNLNPRPHDPSGTLQFSLGFPF